METETTTIEVDHTCDPAACPGEPVHHIGGVASVRHSAPVQVHDIARLGCGCTRARGTRCDGSGIEWITVQVCERVHL